MHTHIYSSPALTPSLHGPSRSLPPSRGGMSVCFTFLCLFLSSRRVTLPPILCCRWVCASVLYLFCVSVSLCFCVSVSLCLFLFARPITLTATLSGEVCLCLHVSEVLCFCVSSSRKGPSRSLPPFRVCVSMSMCLCLFARPVTLTPTILRRWVYVTASLYLCVSVSLCLCVSSRSLSPS